MRNLSHFKKLVSRYVGVWAASMTVDADVMMGRPYTNVTRIPVYVVLEKVATSEAAASLVAAMKFVVALECFDFR